jgi:predicted P-loop ATPase
MQIGGVWLVELAELTSLNRSGIERIKSFPARKVDRFRAPYGRASVESLGSAFSTAA